jgi:hypothetical protein
MSFNENQYRTSGRSLNSKSNGSLLGKTIKKASKKLSKKNLVNFTEIPNGYHKMPNGRLMSDSSHKEMELTDEEIQQYRDGGYIVEEYADGGPIVKQRRGVRNNSDGSVSSHLMRAEYIPERGWIGFPSLFQDSKPYADDSQNWVDMSKTPDEDWMTIYEEANRRGEVYDFGDDKEAALAFGKGSWKDQLPKQVSDRELCFEEGIATLPISNFDNSEAVTLIILL